jgi:hypothetical protein
LGSLCLQVVLAANDMPSINDVTYTELIEIIAKVIGRTCRTIILLDSWLCLTRSDFPVEG